MARDSGPSWAGAAPMAPSIKRSDPMGWLRASAALGFGVGALALALLWRPLPLLPAPPGALHEHLAAWATAAVHAALPRLLAADARAYADLLRGLPREGQIAIIWRCALALWLACMPGVFLARSYFKPRDALIHLRGSLRHEGAEAVARLNATLAPRVARRPDHEIAPGVPYPSHMHERHILLIGGTGSGKSTILKPLIEKVVAAGEQIMVFDPKSDLTMSFAALEIIAPWDKRTLSWDIARDMRNPLDMRRFAASMIRESQDPMWSNASRQLVVGLMIYLKANRRDRWGWRELRDLLALPQAQLLPIMQRWHPEAVRAVEKASVTTAGILINMSSFCAPVFDLAEAWGDVPENRRVSFVEWAKGKSRHKQIILQGHGAYTELTKSYVEGIIGTVSAIVNSVEMDDDPSRKITFCFDECAQMGNVPLRPLFEVGRSRGVRVAIAVQDLSQLEEIYGVPMVQAIVSMCGTLLVGQMLQGDTAEKLCKAFGTREVERESVSTSTGSGSDAKGSRTLSYSREEVALYKPSELTSRLGETPDGKGVVFILFTGGHAYELFWPHYKGRRERMGHMPAAWTYGGARSELDFELTGGFGSVAAAVPAEAAAGASVGDSAAALLAGPRRGPDDDRVDS